MKFIKRLSKRTRIISLMILLVMVSATTIAFFQDYATQLNNSFDLKSIHTEIKENNQSTTLTKIPFVENTDVTDVMVRIRLDISGDFGDFGDFALAGIDTNYAVGSDNFNSYTDDEGNAFVNCRYYSTSENSSDYWTSVTKDGENKYSCYYYYNFPLKAKGSLDENDKPLDVTQPLFDRILLRDNGQFISYNEANDDQKTKFAALENVTITVYQESVPLTVTTDDGTLNAQYSGNNIIGFNDQNSGTYKIWNYFMSQND